MKNRVIIFSVLVLAVVCLGIGFSAYSSTLTISTGANVNPSSSNFRLVFANNNNVNNLDYGYVLPLNNSTYGGRGTIYNDINRPLLSGLTASFDDKGESVSYMVYIVNIGQYTTYLNNFSFVEKNGTFKSCVAREGTNATSVANVCQYINMTVTIDEDTFSSNSQTLSYDMDYSLAPGESIAMLVTITYASNATNPNGDFYVVFGDLQITYSTIPNS